MARLKFVSHEVFHMFLSLRFSQQANDDQDRNMSQKA